MDNISKTEMLIAHYDLWDFTQKLEPNESDRSAALDPIGLIVQCYPELGEYPCPPNTAQFAGTGGDFVTFSYLDQGDSLYLDAPVIMTLPPCIHGECMDIIVGENLYDFLCLGSQLGFFSLEKYPQPEFFDLYCNPGKAWEGFEEEEAKFAPSRGEPSYRSCKREKELLKLLTEEFSLRPWTDIKQRLSKLQKQYKKLVKRSDWW